MMRKITTTVCLMAVLLNPIEARTKPMGGRHNRAKGRKLQEPDVDQMDMSLFREHEEGFPGGLFYEDTEGEAQMQQMIPQWRQTGKAKGKSDKTWQSKKCNKSRRLQGKGSSKGKSASSKGCSKGGASAPSPWFGNNPTSPTWPTGPTWPTSPTWPIGPTWPGSAPTPVSSPSSPVVGPTDPIMPITVPVSSPVVAPVTAPSGTVTGSDGDGDGRTEPITRDWDANAAVCASISVSSNKRAGGPAIAFNDLSLDVDLDLRVRSKNGLVVPPLLDSYSKFVRLYTLGCFDEAAAELDTLTRRRLLTEPLFQATMNSWFEDGATCVGTNPKTCDYVNSIWVYYQNNGNESPNEAEVKQRVRDALSVIAQALEGHPDIDDVAVDTVAVSAARDNGEDDGSTTSAGTIVGATAGGLAALLLLLFLAKRKRDGSDEVSHLKFVDDEETYVNEFEGKPGESDSDESGRRVHVVGESDSVMSGWTGYSVDEDSITSGDGDRSGKLGHQMGDVHMCSSATCEICEKRRQMGVTFIKTASPPMPERPPLVPRDATREYVAEDVVAL